jgi:hypothetical protein
MLRRIADGTEDWVNGVLQHDEKPHPESLSRHLSLHFCKANALEAEGVLQPTA